MLGHQIQALSFKSPLRLWWIIVVAVLVVEVIVFLWLRPEKQHWESVDTLRLSVPDSAEIPLDLSDSGESSEVEITTSFHFKDQPERLKGAVEQLSFAHGVCGVFLPTSRPTLSTPALELFYFEYDAGNPRFIHDVFGHAPEVCMRAIGAELRATHDPRSIDVDGSTQSVRVLEFTTPSLNGPLWIFKLTWVPEESPYQPTDVASSLRREKVLSGLFGDPRPPARVVLVGARNFQDLEAAWQAYEKVVVDHLSMISPPT